MKKIMVVDDNPDVVSLVKLRLEANQYVVVTASDGDEALEKLKVENPDLLVLDIIMPKVDGYSVIKEMKNDPVLKNIPVVILTAKDKMRDLFEIEGVKDYIVKPFVPEELLGKVEKALQDSSSDI